MGEWGCYVCLTDPPFHPQMMIILGVICAIILIIIIGEWGRSGLGPFFWRGFPSRFWVLKVINLVFMLQHTFQC